MTITDWTAPAVTRTDPPYLADEHAMLRTYIEYHRQTLLLKCAGLTDAQLKTAASAPSTLTLLGLIRHMAEVERWWFRIRVAGEPVDHLYCTDERPDGEFDDVADADAAADFATYERERAAVDAAMADRSLDDTFLDSHRQADITVRWVYLHMLEEYARHNGHADLLRESIDGATGE